MELFNKAYSLFEFNSYIGIPVEIKLINSCFQVSKHCYCSLTTTSFTWGPRANATRRLQNLALSKQVEEKVTGLTEP